ncbi:MAG: hypothetical protein J2P37_36850 [Ktedonobacteraceae bacterium]|nr:hypothetical protein [Ktedonobacteraceae bacterium]
MELPRYFYRRYHHVISTVMLALVFAACAQPTGGVPSPTPTGRAVSPTRSPVAATVTPTVQSTPTPRPAPRRYTSRVILRGVGRPDDLALDLQGRLLFSDEVNGTISRINADGSVTVLLRNLAGPEGLVVLSDGTIIIAEQETNRIVSLAPGAKTPAVLRALPGKSSAANCKHGVDGIGFDPTTNSIIVPDSPTGEVYRMSVDGKTLTRLASGMTRPTGAGVDDQGNIFIADECGHAVWKIAPGGKTMRIGGFGMPDDVISDQHGNLLVIDLDPRIHALIRLNLATGKRETLDSQGYIEPQGLIMDQRGHIFVADDFANIVKEYTPQV